MMTRTMIHPVAGAVLCMLLLAGCVGNPVKQADSGRAVTYRDVGVAGSVAGVGVESQDIVAVSDEMVRDILANAGIAGGGTRPRIIMDTEYFKNESTQRLNKNLLVDRLRIQLQRASRGQLSFVSRESAGMVATERQLKRDGVTDTGTQGLTRAQAGADYRLIGRIATQDARSASSGEVERYTQLSFELIDLENSLSVWANQYEMKKGGRDDAIYR